MNSLLKLLLIAQLFLFINGYYLHVPHCYNCRPSLTTASGPFAPIGTILPGQLIFEDNFDKFNLKAWEHSLTLSGKGVSFNNSNISLKKIINFKDL